MRYGQIFVLCALLAGCAILNPGSEVPAPRARTPVTLTVTQIAGRLAAADAVAMGRVVEVKEYWEWGFPCPGIIARLQGCRDQDAWRIEVKGHRPGLFWGFPPGGDYLPIAVGMEAIFLLGRQWRVPEGRCSQMAEYASSCRRTEGEFVLAVGDTLDILLLSDSAVVDSLWRQRGRR